MGWGGVGDGVGWHGVGVGVWGGGRSKPGLVMSTERRTIRGPYEYFASFLNNKMRTQEEARQPEEYFGSVLNEN